MGARHHVAVDPRNDDLHARPGAQDLRADFGLNVCILHPAALAEVNANVATPEIHGGKNETSMMLAIAPQLVRRNLIARMENPPDGEAIRKTILQKGVTWPWT